MSSSETELTELEEALVLAVVETCESAQDAGRDHLTSEEWRAMFPTPQPDEGIAR